MGEQAETMAIRKKIYKYLVIFIAMVITTSGFESTLKIQHIYLKEKSDIIIRWNTLYFNTIKTFL